MTRRGGRFLRFSHADFIDSTRVCQESHEIKGGAEVAQAICRGVARVLSKSTDVFGDSSGLYPRHDDV